MNKLNNKGFAISSILYGILIIIFLLITLLMSILSTSRKNNNELADAVANDLNNYSELSKEVVNRPELYGSMIPVIYDEESSKWKTVSATDENWYDYYNQKWANAVTIYADKRNNYLNKVGVEININDINTMWVWIPRYSYTLKTSYGYSIEGASSLTYQTPGAFNIKWVGTQTRDVGEGKYSGDTPTSYVTPKGFTFGTTQLAGFWAAKFEVAADESSTCASSKTSDNCNNANITPVIKPNLSSWGFISIYNMFNVSLKINDSGNSYGIDTSSDSHMMKNSEWAAIAYLSQSQYGKYGNADYTGSNKEIYINNNTKNTTGCSRGAPGTGEDNQNYTSSCTYTYDNTINRGSGTGAGGAGASTTGTIYGIYDMSGGAWENVMGNYQKKLSSSGFTTMPNSKYCDYFQSLDDSDARTQALKETGSWYTDGNWYNSVNIASISTYPWILRGGRNNNGHYAGPFYNTFTTGELNTGEVATGFRIVLSKQ